jgi:hypothetical protein
MEIDGFAGSDSPNTRSFLVTGSGITTEATLAAECPGERQSGNILGALPTYALARIWCEQNAMLEASLGGTPRAVFP